MHPRCKRFVSLCTPASLFHLFQGAARWDDVRYLILDEVHKHIALFLLFFHFYAYLWKRNDARVRHVKLLLLTATRQGKIVDDIEKTFI